MTNYNCCTLFSTSISYLYLNAITPIPCLSSSKPILQSLTTDLKIPISRPPSSNLLTLKLLSPDHQTLSPKLYPLSRYSSVLTSGAWRKSGAFLEKRAAPQRARSARLAALPKTGAIFSARCADGEFSFLVLFLLLVQKKKEQVTFEMKNEEWKMKSE